MTVRGAGLLSGLHQFGLSQTVIAELRSLRQAVTTLQEQQQLLLLRGRAPVETRGASTQTPRQDSSPSESPSPPLPESPPEPASCPGSQPTVAPTEEAKGLLAAVALPEDERLGLLTMGTGRPPERVASNSALDGLSWTWPGTPAPTGSPDELGQGWTPPPSQEGSQDFVLLEAYPFNK